MREMESGLREVCLTPIGWKPIAYCEECKVDLEKYRTLISSMVAFNKWNKGVWKGVMSQCPKCGRGVKKAQIQSIITAYEWSADKEVGRYWLTSDFQEHAHRDGQLETVPLTDEFIQMWEDFQTFLWEVAKKLESQSTKFIDHIEELLAKPEPTKEDIDRLLNKIPANAVNHWHFFNRLEHPGWFKWLEKKDIFAWPHAPIDDADSPPWPAGRYLVRMAKVPELTEDVVNILTSLAKTKNATIVMTILEAAKVLSPPRGAIFAVYAQQWLELKRAGIGYELGEFMENIAKHGSGKEALIIGKALLQIPPTPTEGSLLRHDPATLVESHEFQAAVEEWMPAVVDAAGLPALELLCNTLDAALTQTREPTVAEGEDYLDYSHIWRFLIGDHEVHHSHEKINQLISAIRDAGLSLSKKDVSVIPAILACLRKYKWTIFKRIELYFLSEWDAPPAEDIRSRLSDRAFFEEDDIKREYKILAEKHCRLLTPDEKNVIIGWLEAGVDLERYRTSFNTWHGRLPTPEEEHQHVGYWQLSRSYPFKDALTGTAWEKKLTDLIAEFGEPEEEERSSAFARAVGDISPLGEEEVSAMTIEKLTDYMRTWKPSGEWDAPDAEGLGHQLNRLVLEDPAKFAAEAKRFEGLDPTYIRSFIGGIQEVAKAEKVFSWKEVLELCAWVMSQPREIPGRTPQKFDIDPDWSWTRMAIVRLLNAGFEEGKGSIPIELREQAWSLLEALTKDPDPTSEDESKGGDENMDPYHTAINSVRSKAMEAVIFYMFWVNRHLGKKAETDAETDELRKTGVFGQMPEVERVLDAHIDPEKETSLAVRSVFGRWLPNLDFMAHPWVERSLPKLFPTAERHTRLKAVVWETYVIANPLFNKTFDTLKEEYSKVMDSLREPAKPIGKRLGDPVQHFASHIMMLALRGIIGLESGDTLLKRFFENASDELRGVAIGGIGQILKNDDDVKSVVLDRAIKLWEHRLKVAKESGNPTLFQEEMESFAWWVACERFDDAWTLAQLKEALLIAKDVDMDFMVVERLAALAEKFPIQCIDCLKLIVEGKNKARWGARGYIDNAKAVIRTVHAKGGKEGQQKAKDLVGILVSLSAIAPLEAKQLGLE